MGSLLLAATFISPAIAQEQERDTMRLFNEVTFYDGYLYSNNPDSLVHDGVLRHTTSLYAVKLTDEQLSQIGDSLWMKVYAKACCDNYDRIGNVFLSLVNKGDTIYNPDSVPRVELGRFVTPFMNMNKTPDTCPYEFNVNYLTQILRDADIRAKYDIWIELKIFGVPYTANSQIKGCAGRSDVWKGTLDFVTSRPAGKEVNTDVLVPIVVARDYDYGNFNNYKEGCTDTIGKTVKTWYFNVPKDVTDGQIVLVSSNHGANSGGEEYNRRWHYVFVDDSLMLTYRPGRSSCEPFRQYNTQRNGIYGSSKKSDAVWQSFSNWCPGDIIDNRIIDLGPLTAGEHKVKVSVPDAQFVNQQGDIPVSIFFQGTTEGTLPQVVPTAIGRVYGFTKQMVEVKNINGCLSATSDRAIVRSELYSVDGRRLYSADNDKPILISKYPKGIYLYNIELIDGLIETHKITNR